MDFKKEAARSAISFIKNNSTIGLGAGSTVAYIIEFLKEEIKNGLGVSIVTSSFTTQLLLQKHGFRVLPIASLAQIDIYFDGCDQLDQQLNALKSGGGIHTREKLLASMADQFILVGDEEKRVARFDARFPLVIELLPEAFSFIPQKIQQVFPGVSTAIRVSDKKDGVVITENGNYLLDVWFPSWPELSGINTQIKGMTGVVETSLFYGMAHKAILGGKEGVKVVERM